MISNIVNKGKKPVKECASYSESKEIHHFTRHKAGATAPRDYRRLAGGFNGEGGDYSAITSPRSHASIRQGGAITHMMDNSNNVDHKI